MGNIIGYFMSKHSLVRSVDQLYRKLVIGEEQNRILKLEIKELETYLGNIEQSFELIQDQIDTYYIHHHG